MNDIPSPGGPMIEVVDVHKSYLLGRRLLEILRGLHLTVDRGEFLAIRGASGAGKSTLLHLLGGLDRPTSGRVCFDGREVSSLSRTELARFRNRQVGFVFQAYHLLPELSAIENVCLPARMNREPAVAVVQRARGLLDRVGLGDRLDHRPYELSGGEQQRVAVARALINGPELVLADEPTGNLDSRTGGEILELLTLLRAERRITLIIATHDERVAAGAQRVVELVDGKIGLGD